MPISAYQLHTFFTSCINHDRSKMMQRLDEKTGSLCLKLWTISWETLGCPCGMDCLEDPLLLFQWNFHSTPHCTLWSQSQTTNTAKDTHTHTHTHTHTLPCLLRRRQTPATTKSHARDTHVNYKALPELRSAPKGNQPFNASSMRI